MSNINISTISSTDMVLAGDAIKTFYNESSTLFTFPGLNEGGLRFQLWSALINHLSSNSSSEIHIYCLSCIRILSRDKNDLNEMICEKWINVLVDCAGLYKIVSDEEELIPATLDLSVPVIVEALKCLCNLVFNSPVAQALCAKSCAAEGIITRLRTYRHLAHASEIIVYDMKLLFILTALREDVRSKVRGLHGMTYLVECMDEIVKCVTSGEAMAVPESKDESGLIQGGTVYMCNDDQQVILCEMLKIQFNLLLKSKDKKDKTSNEDECILIHLISILNNLLVLTASSKEKESELHNNVVNILTSIPDIYYSGLISPLSVANYTVPEHLQYEGHNVQSVYLLLRFLHLKLSYVKNLNEQYECLSPIMTVMIKGVTSNRVFRVACRAIVLPPLKDVSRPPEEGVTLRSRLCALLTSPVILIRNLVAEFLFILCKEKVGRMVKYTGYGNAAGLLAQKGLLAGGRGSTQYSSSSEDSDTEEYTAARSTLDPVTGFCRPPRADPMEGYTEEQKEHEAMKLVGLLEKLSAQGIVQPARVGTGGRPEPISHFLQLRDEPPQRPQS